MNIAVFDLIKTNDIFVYENISNSYVVQMKSNLWCIFQGK